MSGSNVAHPRQERTGSWRVELGESCILLALRLDGPPEVGWEQAAVVHLDALSSPKRPHLASLE